MRQYQIDELRRPDYEKLQTYLAENLTSAAISGIYWLPVDEELLTDIQTSHLKKCGPFYVSLHLEETVLTCELLVRSQQVMRCACIGYVTEAQRNRIIAVVDAIFEQLDIMT